MSDLSVNVSYDSKMQALKAAGLKTTGLNNGEANFADYFKALQSTQEGKALLASLGGDEELQMEVAELYTQRNVYDFETLKSKLASKGITVSEEWVSGVDHMIDQKFVGTGVEQHAKGLTVITFEKNGKTFKVADANGNAALETEELMFNDILGDINSDLSALANGSNTSSTNSADSKVKVNILDPFSSKDSQEDENVTNETNSKKPNNQTEQEEAKQQERKQKINDYRTKHPELNYDQAVAALVKKGEIEE